MTITGVSKFIVMALLVILPSINSSFLVHGAISSKMFVFLFLSLLLAFVLMIKYIGNRDNIMRLSTLDIAIFIWILYFIFNSILHHVPASPRLYELLGLAIFYVVVRQMPRSDYMLLLGMAICGGIIQAFHGEMQILGIMESNNALFTVTGSSFNPGPYAGYLSCILPVVLGVYLYKEQIPSSFISKISKSVILSETLWFFGFIILLVIIVSGSRAAVLSVLVSSFFLFSIRYSVYTRFKNLSVIYRSIVLVSLISLFAASILGLAKLKESSVHGRLLIWKVTSGIIYDHPLVGVGLDNFKCYYMNAQAEYFKARPESLDIQVAGDTNYCFNEFLQHTAEGGVIGLVLVIAILSCAFACRGEKVGYSCNIAKAGLLGIVVFAMFSYPSQILPIKIMLVFFLAVLSTQSVKKFISIRMCKNKPVKFVIGVTVLAFLLASAYHLNGYCNSWKNWSLSLQSYKMRDYSGSISYDCKAWPYMNTSGEYLMQYGKALYMAEKPNQALSVIQRAIRFFPNIVAYTVLGDCYKQVGAYKNAEQSYLQAWYMNPSRFYPKYLLAKLYAETGEKEKAVNIAHELLSKEVKVESMAIEEIKREMNKMLQYEKE